MIKSERERTRMKMRELILLAKTKQPEYTKDSVMTVMCLCCSSQMHEAGHTSEQALEKAIELVKTKPKPKVYSELLKLTGFEE